MDRNKPFKTRITLFLLLMAAVFFSCDGPVEETTGEAANRIRVRIFEYEKQDFALTERFSGEVKPQKQVNLSFNIPGKIEQLYFDEGDLVKKGQLLARLEQSGYKTTRDQSLAHWEKAKRDFIRAAQLGNKKAQEILADRSIAW